MKECSIDCNNYGCPHGNFSMLNECNQRMDSGQEGLMVGLMNSAGVAGALTW